MSDYSSDESENLHSNYTNRNMSKKVVNFFDRNPQFKLKDLPKKYHKRIKELLKYDDNKSSRKRKQPDGGFEDELEPSRKKVKMDQDLLKEIIKKDIEAKKLPSVKRMPTFLEHLLQSMPDNNSKNPPILDIQFIPINNQTDFKIIEEYDSDEDSDYDPEEEEEEMNDEKIKEEIQEVADQILSQMTIFGQPLKKKGELDLSGIENEEEKQNILKVYEEIKNINNIKLPLKIKVLASDLPVKVKATVVKKLEMLEQSSFDNGDSKKFYDWIESLLKIPFNKYCDMPISNKSSKDDIGNFLNNFYNNLDKAIYGHKKVKQVLTETIAKWITHPTTKGHALAIVGPPGVGKTSLIREGLAKGLNRPFCSLSLAGMHDEAYLTGFALTYEGSQEGRISKMLKNSGCMNPIIFMDELDKVDTVRHGLSIMNKLIEITDFSQNHEFEDLYYQDVKLDLSKTIFVFSLNHLENVDPILRDRLEIIHVKGFENNEKVKIAKDYLIPSVLKDLGFKSSDIIFDDKIIKYIILQLDDEKGVRKLKEAINKICRKINILRFTKENTDFNTIYELPITITQKMVDKILTRPDKPFLHMYI